MFGVWRGPGKGFTRAGPYEVTQTERIGTFLGGTLIVVEGKGYRADGTVAFNAFGVISAENLGYAKVELQKTIAQGHGECRVVVYLTPTPEAESANGREYFKS